MIKVLTIEREYGSGAAAIARTVAARLAASVGPVYLLKEAWGLLDADGPFVNVSDGGHLENLGLYELLRRR